MGMYPELPSKTQFVVSNSWNYINLTPSAMEELTGIDSFNAEQEHQ